MEFQATPTGYGTYTLFIFCATYTLFFFKNVQTGISDQDNISYNPLSLLLCMQVVLPVEQASKQLIMPVPRPTKSSDIGALQKDSFIAGTYPKRATQAAQLPFDHMLNITATQIAWLTSRVHVNNM